MRAVQLLCAAVVALLLTTCAEAFNLLVKANGGCTGFQYLIKQNGVYSYNSTMGDLLLGKGCTAADLMISKLYVPGACADTRLNNFGFKSLDPRNFGCDKVEDYSEKTCNTVFSEAAKSDIVSNLTTGDYIDSENICWDADVAYVFVKNDCANDSRVGVDIKTSAYQGPSCQSLLGGRVGLSKGAIAGIVIGIVVVLVLLLLCIWCCCCQLCRR